MNTAVNSSLSISYSRVAEKKQEESTGKPKILFEDFITKYLSRNTRPKHYVSAYQNLLMHLRNLSLGMSG